MACKIFRVGVFFDGTGNNQARDGASESNVSKLNKLYKKGEFEINGQKVTCASVYMNGVGTYDTWWEHHLHWIDRKYEKGGGGGGAERINEAINKILGLLQKHPYGAGESDYKSREIDIFGFSRGAAMARDFINTFNTKSIALELKHVKFNFIGIYDTVGSFGRPSNDVDRKPRDPKKHSEGDMNIFQAGNGDYGIQEHVGGGFFEPYNFNISSGSAKKIIHMTAHSEVRKNFPLYNSQGAGFQYNFLGVHSDIGGGYPERKSEKHQIPLPKVFTGSKGLGNLLHNQKAATRAYGEKEIARLKKEKNLLGKWYVEVDTTTHMGYRPDEYRAYLKRNKIVNNDLSDVTLHLMHEEAVNSKVPLNPITTEIPESMKYYYAYVKENKIHAYTYAEKADGHKINMNYVHHSAVDPAGISTNYYGDRGVINILFNDSADGGGNDARYKGKNGGVIDGRTNPKLADKVEREVYENKPSSAIVPV